VCWFTCHNNLPVPPSIPTAKRFEEKGAICNLGYYKELDKNTSKTTLQNLFCDHSLRSSMSRNGKAFVDGLGFERVINKMNNLISIAGENK